MYFVDNKKYKEIARELRMSKNTVKEIIKNKVLSKEYIRTTQAYPALKEYITKLEEKLEHDKNEPRRRKRKSMKLYKEIKSLGYTGSYEAVNNYVNKWKLKNTKQASNKAFIPLEFEAGEAFQFDWSEEEIELAGKITRIKVAQIRLAYSRFFLTVAFPNEQLEMVMEAHNKAFEFFAGTCKKGLYDNMKTAVHKILIGKDRIYNKKFLELASHYLFEPTACTPAAGWEKGQVEGQVKTSRYNFFTPLVKVDTLDELNKKLKQCCLDWSKSTKHPTIEGKTTWEVYQEEKRFLIPYCSRFDSCKVQPSVVSAYSLINYDTNSYSVDSAYVGKKVAVHIYCNQIAVIHDGKEIARHVRCFKKHKSLYDPWHYVPVLEKKPGAIRNGAPFKQLDLPESVNKIRAKLLLYSKEEKQFIKLLLNTGKDKLSKLDEACQKALQTGISNADLIIDLMNSKQSTALDDKCEHNKILGAMLKYKAENPNQLLAQGV